MAFTARDTDGDKGMRHCPKKMSSCFKEHTNDSEVCKRKSAPCSPSAQPQIRSL